MLGGVFLAITGRERSYVCRHRADGPQSDPGLLVRDRAAGTAGSTMPGRSHLPRRSRRSTRNPFFRLAPSSSILSARRLATVATIIASRAIITGSISAAGLIQRCCSAPPWSSQPATYLGDTGQIFRTVRELDNDGADDCTHRRLSQFLSSIAGLWHAVLTTISFLTTALLCNVMRKRWRSACGPALTASGLFLAVDFRVLRRPVFRIREGGSIRSTFGTLVFIVMVSWHFGFEAMRRHLGVDGSARGVSPPPSRRAASRACPGRPSSDAAPLGRSRPDH